MKDLIILENGMEDMTAALYAKRANLDFKIVGKEIRIQQRESNYWENR